MNSDCDSDADVAEDAFYYASQTASGSGSAGELLTLSFGPYANFAAAHFWNAREADIDWAESGKERSGKSSNPDGNSVHFRPGLTASYDSTFTPRALIFDLRDNFGRAGRHGGLYIDDAPEDAGLQWDGGVDRVSHPAYASGAYQNHLNSLGMMGYEAPADNTVFNLEGTVRTWSDYARTFFHPRSLAALPTAIDPATMSTTSAFDIWRATEHSEWAEEMMDALRRLVEECGRMQGIQILATDDGWGGFAAGLAERAEDEIGKTNTVVFALNAAPVVELDGRAVSDFTTPRPSRSTERLKSLHMLSDRTSLVLPFSIPSLNNTAGGSRAWSAHLSNLNLSLPYHTSYLASTAIDSFSLPFIIPGHGIREAIDTLRVMDGAKIAGLQSAWPLPVYTSTDPKIGVARGLEVLLAIAKDTTGGHGNYRAVSSASGIWDGLNASSARSAASYINLPTARGTPRDTTHRIIIRGLEREVQGAAREVLEGAWGVGSLAGNVEISSSAITQLDSSPAIFGPDLDKHGRISTSNSGQPTSFPGFTRSYSSPVIGDRLSALLRQAMEERRVERTDRSADSGWDESREGWEGLVGVYGDLGG